ncbi:hypothetical protein EKK58_04600 [Candidatus Dependentiae bacterium]|nr:MAG: hypothetical protein EKK58_04600 [Candidatus Dependentiae bacterium]
MKINKKIILSLGCVLLLQQAEANLFTNMVKTAVDYMAGKVEKGVSYVDQIWFNVEQDLYKPMEQAKAKLDAIKNTPSSLAMHYTDKNFASHTKNDDAKTQTVKHLLYLLEQKKVALADETELHCFKKASYTAGFQAQDHTDLRAMINDTIASVESVQNDISSIFKKSYARKNQRIFTDVIKGREHDVAFVNGKAQEFKAHFWAKVCMNNQAVLNNLLNQATYQETVDGLYAAFEEQLKQAKDEEHKNVVKGLIMQVKNTALLDETLDIFVTLNTMLQLLTNVDVSIASSTFVTPILVEYNKLVIGREQINKKQKNIDANQLVAFVQKNPQEMLKLIQNRPVVVAQEIQKALIDGILVDPAHADQTIFKTSYPAVGSAFLNICSPVVTMLKSMRNHYEILSIINTERVTISSCGTKTIKNHFKTSSYKDYVVFAQELADAIIKQKYANNTPEPLQKQYKDIIVAYGAVRCLYKLVKKLQKMADGTVGVKQIHQLLTEDKNIHDAYVVIQKNQKVFDNNDAVKGLQLSSDAIDLDTLLKDRGDTFSILKQRCNVEQKTPWQAASAIVKAGEDAYEAYLHIISMYKRVLNLPGVLFDFDGLISYSLEHYVHSIVAKVVSAANGSKTEALTELDELNNTFEKYLSEANFTDQARKIIKEIGALYIKNIKEALKAQVIAAWYVHDIAWKMRTESMQGPKRSILNGLRKITPTCGQSIELEVIS